MIQKLKGGVGISINPDGIMTKTTTWMLIADDDNVLTSWMAFQTDVETFAGSIGDNYKKPVQDTNGRECSSSVEDATFKVSSIDIVCAPGRTHYEVTFVNTQNLSVMHKIGNVSLSVNSNNEKTKTITYQIDTDNIDNQALASGTAVLWAGSDYLLESSNYSAQSPTRYTLTLTAKDMSQMMIGVPTFSEDAYGQLGASVTWRYSATAYQSLIKPKAGEVAEPWLGAVPDASSYRITAVTASNDGILGYLLKIDCKHVSKRLVRLDEKLTYNAEEGLKRGGTIVYQSDREGKDSWDEFIGREAGEEGLFGLSINNLTKSQTGVEDWEVTLEATSDLGGLKNVSVSNASGALAKEVTISMNMSSFVLTADQCGYFRSPSALEWVVINNPRTEVFPLQYNFKSFLELNKTGWDSGSLLSALKTGAVGYSTVTSIWKKGGADKPDIALRDSSTWEALSAADITRFELTTPAHAQPGWTNEFFSTQNQLFRKWEARERLPIFPTNITSSNNYPTFVHKNSGLTLDKELAEKYIGYSVPMMSCQVSLNYKGDVVNVIKRDWDNFFLDAVAKIRSTRFTSYKRTGFNVSKIVDDHGNSWTKVTTEIGALLEGNWNPTYNEKAAIS